MANLRPLFLLSMASFLVVYGQEFDFLASRSEIMRDWNLFTFRCETAEDGVVRDPVYFRDADEVEIPRTNFLPDGSALFRLNRTLEGEYRCGSRNQFGRRLSDPPKVLVARPDGSDMPSSITTFYGQTGSTVRLDCSITPGVLFQHYFVTWRSATNTSRIFYQTLPGREEPIVLNNRYTLHPGNFSLFIHEVTVADMAETYVCVLEVQDLQFASARLPFVYTATENVNLSISIFKAPEIREVPEKAIVTNGETVSFTCSAFSSPMPSLIKWTHLGNIVSPNDRFDISTISTDQPDGALAESTFTIYNVTGFDSSVVECIAEYRAEDLSEAVASATRETALVVLDTVQEFNPLAIQTGGFIYAITLKAAIPIPVSLRFVYNDVNSNNNRTFTSMVAYTDEVINHVASRERVPFDHFRVQIALVNGNSIGPFYIPNSTFSRAGLTNIEKTFIAITVILGILLGLVFIVFLLLLGSWCNLDKAFRSLVSTVWGSMFRNCCKCCLAENRVRTDAESDLPKLSNKGFTQDAAQKYLDAVKNSIEFAKDDTIMNILLKQRVNEFTGLLPEQTSQQMQQNGAAGGNEGADGGNEELKGILDIQTAKETKC